MAMEEPLEELLVHLREAIDKAEDGSGDEAELSRLVAEVDRRLNETDPEGVVDDLRGRGHEVRDVAPDAGRRHRSGGRRPQRPRPVGVSPR